MSGECVPSAQHSTTFRMNLRDAYDHNLSRAICHLFMSFTIVIVFLFFFLSNILIFMSWATISLCQRGPYFRVCVHEARHS